MSTSDAIGAERLDALLRGDAPRTPGEAARVALVRELRGGALRAPEPLRARVLGAAPAGRRLRAPGLRRPALVLVPVALVLALAAAAVHGVVSPAPRQAASAAETTAPTAKAAPTPKAAPALGAEAAQSADRPAVRERSRAARALDSGLGFLAREGLGLLAALAVAGLVLVLARARRRRGERLLDASPTGRRGDLME